MTLAPSRAEPRFLIMEHRARVRRFRADHSALIAVQSVPGVLPDWVTPTPATSDADFGDELERVAATRSESLEASFDRLKRAPHPAASAGSLRTQIVDGLWRAHRDTFADTWSASRNGMAAEVARRGQQLADQGVRRVLQTLHPRIRFDGRTLTLFSPRFLESVDLELPGRGIVLVPSPVWTNTFSSKFNGIDPLVIVYPIGQAVRTMAGPPGDPTDNQRALEKLLGVTRAHVFLSLSRGCGLSTTQLAAAAHCSIPSASEHAAVLRAAGLLVTRRHGQHVTHSITETGRRLADGWRTPRI
ncbi:ArsR/SmtB family transcription factor [Microlunatus endophyticus]|uniref:ArsR/SmtB family transcription factor n=1 Tax=Microlunatus endophyticus TaxID=1716077 RepID=UPI0016648556|nr:helix-turn-helix domain-containing protein [Microlunatus endophyticus]